MEDEWFLMTAIIDPATIHSLLLFIYLKYAAHL